MRIKAHGVLAEIIGKSSFELKNIKDSNALINSLLDNYPQLENVSYTIVINDIVVNKNTQLSENDQVQIVPMFEGG